MKSDNGNSTRSGQFTVEPKDFTEATNNVMMSPIREQTSEDQAYK